MAVQTGWVRRLEKNRLTHTALLPKQFVDRPGDDKNTNSISFRTSSHFTDASNAKHATFFLPLVSRPQSVEETPTVVQIVDS